MSSSLDSGDALLMTRIRRLRGFLVNVERASSDMAMGERDGERRETGRADILLIRRDIRHRLRPLRVPARGPELRQGGGGRPCAGQGVGVVVIRVVELLEDVPACAGVWQGLVRKREVGVVVELFFYDGRSARHGVTCSEDKRVRLGGR